MEGAIAATVGHPVDPEYRRELRALVARELHDGPIRELTGCVVRLEAYRSTSQNPEMQVAITGVEEHVRAALVSLRRIIRDLRDEAPEEDVVTSIRAMIARYGSSTPADLRLVVSPAWPELITSSVALGLVRIVQEAVSNAVMHSRAQHVVIELAADQDRLSVTVSDDGQGIPVGATRGGGIVGMRELAALIGGRLAIRGRHPGTEVRVEAVFR